MLGPRQCGKTTLARQFVPADSLNYFDLEDPQGLARLSEPDIALRPLKGLVVIDEIQRRPDLFPLLRVLADRRPLPARFLILGSASPELLKQSSETLAGRLETVPLEGFRLADLGAAAQGRHWLRGGFPLSFTARTETGSLTWRRQFLQTFLERDVPQLGITIPAVALGRFWNMLAHYHGQTWNAAELARALAVSESTVRRYLDLMTGVFMVRQFPPWFENLGKRQVKAPKVYVRDSGLLHALLGIGSRRDLELHPKVGASWEGYAVEEVLKAVATGRGLLLGHASGRGDSTSSCSTAAPHRRRMQTHGRARAHAFHAHRPCRPETRRTLRRLSRRETLCSGR